MAAIAMFFRTIAFEANRHRIRVNVITPSLIVGTRTSEHLLRQEFAAKISTGGLEGAAQRA
jgi:2-hydroxycyclohexanecarboxyl-CoA dehydrogenase